MVGSHASPSHDWWPTTHTIFTVFLNFLSTLSPSLYLLFAFQLSTLLIYNSQVWFVLTTQFLTPITLNGLYLLLLWSYLRQVLPIFEAHSSNLSSPNIFCPSNTIFLSLSDTSEQYFLYSQFLTQTLPFIVQFSSVQWLSHVQLFAPPWTAAHQAFLSITNSLSLLKLMSIESVMPSNHLILCRPLLLPPSIFPSIRVFSNESVFRIRWPKYWSFSINISPSNEYSGLISFRIDWFDLLETQGTLKSLLQHYSSKPSNLWHSAFFIVQLSHHTWLLEKP